MSDTSRTTGHRWLRGLAIAASLLLAACASAPKQELARPASTWQLDFQHPVAYQKLVGDDLLMVGTTRHLWAVDPRSGAKLWRLRNVNTNARDVIEVPGAPYLLVNDAAGGAYDDAGTHVLAVDRADGHLLWESPVLAGRVLQARLDPGRNRLYATVVQLPHGDDTGLLHDLLPGKGLFSGLKREPELAAIDLDSGDVLWHERLDRDVLMRPSYRAGVGSDRREGIRPFDLGIYHPPTLVGDQVCVTYSGIRCFDADSGATTWSDRFDVIEDELGRSYPNPVVEEERLILGDTEHLFAVRPGNGERLWDSEDLDRIPELLNDEAILFGQVGGRYFDIDGEEWTAEGPFAVVAVNKRNGRTLWRHDRVRRSISNLLAVDYQIWFADDEHLFALDRLDGTVVLRRPHKLGEPPLYALLNEAGQVVLVSESEIGGYDAASGSLRWYHEYPAPGPGAWKRLAAGLLNLSGNIFRLSSTILAYGSSALPPIPNITVAGGRKLMSGDSALEDVTGFLGEKLTRAGTAISEESGFANLTGHTQYFVTRPRGVDDFVLAAVDVDTGETRRLTVLPSQSPELVIDEVNGQVYQSLDGRVLAVPLGE